MSRLQLQIDPQYQACEVSTGQANLGQVDCHQDLVDNEEEQKVWEEKKVINQSNE